MKKRIRSPQQRRPAPKAVPWELGRLWSRGEIQRHWNRKVASARSFLVGAFSSAVPGLMATKWISEVAAYSLAVLIGGGCCCGGYPALVRWTPRS